MSVPAAPDLGDKDTLQKLEPSLTDRNTHVWPRSLRHRGGWRGRRSRCSPAAASHPRSVIRAADAGGGGQITCLFSFTGLHKERHWPQSAALKGLDLIQMTQFWTSSSCCDGMRLLGPWVEVNVSLRWRDMNHQAGSCMWFSNTILQHKVADAQTHT